MSPSRTRKQDDDVLPEYDFTEAVRGKYYERYRQGTNVVLLDPDIAAVFRDSEAVNDTLRRLMSLATARVAAQRSRVPRRQRQNKLLQSAPRGKGVGQRKRAGAARD